MAKPVDPATSPLINALRDHLVGPANGVEHHLKKSHIPAETADTLARLYAAGGGKAPFGEFMEVLLGQLLSRKVRLALASIPEDSVKEAKARIFTITEVKSVEAKAKA
jgi:hypothetical protein